MHMALHAIMARVRADSHEAGKLLDPINLIYCPKGAPTMGALGGSTASADLLFFYNSQQKRTRHFAFPKITLNMCIQAASER